MLPNKPYLYRTNNNLNRQFQCTRSNDPNLKFGVVKDEVHRKKPKIPHKKNPLWGVEEPTHHSKRVGRGVPCVVAVLVSCKMWPAWCDVSKKTCGHKRKNSHKSKRNLA